MIQRFLFSTLLVISAACIFSCGNSSTRYPGGDIMGDGDVVYADTEDRSGNGDVGDSVEESDDDAEKGTESADMSDSTNITDTGDLSDADDSGDSANTGNSGDDSDTGNTANSGDSGDSTDESTPFSTVRYSFIRKDDNTSDVSGAVIVRREDRFPKRFTKLGRPELGYYADKVKVRIEESFSGPMDTNIVVISLKFDDLLSCDMPCDIEVVYPAGNTMYWFVSRFEQTGYTNGNFAGPITVTDFSVDGIPGSGDVSVDTLVLESDVLVYHQKIGE